MKEKRELKEILSVDTVVLDRFYYHVRQALPDIHFIDSELRFHRDEVFAAEVIEFVCSFLGQSNKETIEEKSEVEYVPVSVWDHFKQSYFPEWLLRLFPVNVRKIQKLYKVEKKVTKICPHADIKLPDRGPHLFYFTKDQLTFKSD